MELADGSGFAVTGHTFSDGRAEDVFIMKIDCSGSVSWTKTYGTAEEHEYAVDIVEAKYGNKTVMPPGIPTNNGDLIVCGWVEYVSQEQFFMDAYILRVTSAGNLIWNRRYDMTPTLPPVPDYHERLLGLTEAVPTGTAAAGDVIAVGQALVDQTLGHQGIIIRVDGHDGTTGNTTRQRASHFGGAFTRDCGSDSGDSFYGDEIFYSVVEMSDSGEMDQNMVFNVAVAGSSNAPGKDEIYVVKLLGGDPCSVAAERLIGNKATEFGSTCGDNEVATCIREVDWEMSGSSVSQYDLALTGFTDKTVNADFDMFLLTISPADINPTGGINTRYGSTSSSTVLNEVGRSLHPVDTMHSRTEGFILCGTNSADPVGVNDPGDLYLVKTDNAGNASPDCESNYPVWPDTVDWDNCVTPSNTTYGNDTSVTTSTVTTDSDDKICTGAFKPSMRGNTDVEKKGSALSFRFSPNPVKSGDVLMIRDLREIDGGVQVHIYDVSGRFIRSISPHISAGEFAIETQGLPAGTYTMTVEDSQSTGTIQFIVIR